jgi:hypothetical protein
MHTHTSLSRPHTHLHELLDRHDPVTQAERIDPAVDHTAAWLVHVDVAAAAVYQRAQLLAA